MILNQVFGGGSGKLSSGDFVLSALEDLGDGYTALDGSAVNPSDGEAVNNIFGLSSNPVSWRTAELTSFGNRYPQYAKLTNYIDDDIAILFGGYTNGDAEFSAYNRSGDTLTLMEPTNTHSDVSISALKNYVCCPMTPFKFNGKYYFPVFQYDTDDDGDYMSMSLRLYYPNEDFTSFSSLTIWSASSVNSYQKAPWCNVTTDGTYIYAGIAFLSGNRAGTVYTYRYNSSMTKETSTYALSSTSTLNSSSYYFCMAENGAWIFAGRWFAESFGGTVTDIGVQTSSSYLYNCVRLHYVDNKIWAVFGDNQIKIAKNVASLSSPESTRTVADFNITAYYNTTTKKIRRWQHGIYVTSRATSSTGTKITILTEDKSISSTDSILYGSSSSSRADFVAREGMVDVLAFVNVPASGSSQNRVPYIKLTDMSEPRYKVSEISASTSSPYKTLTFGNVGTLPYMIVFFNTKDYSASQPDYCIHAGYILPGDKTAKLTYSSFSSYNTLAHKLQTVTPTISGSQVSIYWASSTSSNSSGGFVGTYKAYAIYKDIIPDTYNTFMKN